MWPYPQTKHARAHRLVLLPSVLHHVTWLRITRATSSLHIFFLYSAHNKVSGMKMKSSCTNLRSSSLNHRKSELHGRKSTTLSTCPCNPSCTNECVLRNISRKLVSHRQLFPSTRKSSVPAPSSTKKRSSKTTLASESRYSWPPFPRTQTIHCNFASVNLSKWRCCEVNSILVTTQDCVCSS